MLNSSVPVKTSFQVTFAPLDLNQVYTLAEDGHNGAIVVMSGRVRQDTGGRAVRCLEYQAYEPMALKVFEAIGQQIEQRWPIVRSIVIHHRTGKLDLGEISVLIAIGAPHRAEAFAACQYAIDTLKHEAPIWKKEFWADGSSSWVSIAQCEALSPPSQPSAENLYWVDHVNLLRESFAYFVGQDLIREAFPLEDLGDGSDVAIARALFYAPFVILSHNTDADPRFTYGNQAALNLFEMTWEELTALPSRLSAESPNQEDRSRLLEAVRTQGYIAHYRGIRISKTGKRFWVDNATVWNLQDRNLRYCGQAAAFAVPDPLQSLTP